MTRWTGVLTVLGPGRTWLALTVLAITLTSAGCWHHSGGDGGGNGGGNGDGTGGSGESLVGGGWGNFQGMATTNYYGMFHGFRGTAVSEIESRVAAAGSLTAFSGAIAEAPPAGSWAFTLINNGVAQAMTCAISGANTSCVDASGCVELEAGDEIAVEVVPTSATANAGGPRWTAVFTAGGSCS